jgi:phenol hydroxylase P0 protein
MARPVQPPIATNIGDDECSGTDRAATDIGGDPMSRFAASGFLPERARPFDVNRRYVRFRELDARDYVLFDFAIGDPELCVELTLPLPAYQAFCKANHVTYLTRDEAAAVDFEKSKWRYGVPGLNHDNEEEQD